MQPASKRKWTSKIVAIVEPPTGKHAGMFTSLHDKNMGCTVVVNHHGIKTPCGSLENDTLGLNKHFQNVHPTTYSEVREEHAAIRDRSVQQLRLSDVWFSGLLWCSFLLPGEHWTSCYQLATSYNVCFGRIKYERPNCRSFSDSRRHRSS